MQSIAKIFLTYIGGGQKKRSVKSVLDN